LPRDPAYEKRYPFLDRDLLEFLFAIPRDQLVRAGHRRFLLRRALAGIVPDEILHRKRKAYVVRAPTLSLSAMRLSVQEMICAELNLIDSNRFIEILERIRQGKEAPIFGVLRILETERWLRGIASSGLLAPSLSQQTFGSPFPSDKNRLTPVHQKFDPS
jgi:asparagine synthase (glutamine-hydrolysing)